MYDEVALSRWIEEAVRKAGITVLLGAVLRGVEPMGAASAISTCATRYGDVRISATGLRRRHAATLRSPGIAGLACREAADGPIYGTQMIVLEDIDEDALAGARRDHGAAVREGAVVRHGPPRRLCVSCFPATARRW